MLWVELLNCNCDPDDGVSAWWRWMREAAPHAETRRAWNEDLALLRTAALRRVLRHESEAVAVASQWLAAVTLRTSLGGHVSGLPMPAFRARRSHNRLTPALEDL